MLPIWANRLMLSSKMKYAPIRRYVMALCLCLLVAVAPHGTAAAVTNPQTGSTGVEGTVASPPPASGGTITTPGNGQTFTNVPITVNGLCPKGLLVKVFANNIFVGSQLCTSGSYSIQVNLFSGQNDIVVRVYDALDQPGPDSNQIAVTFNDQQTVLFGTRVTLSSAYAERGANPGDLLTWPILLSGGLGPYAISTDWGDNTPATLQSEPFAGSITISHTYKTAGVYKVVVKATDHNGTEAFLQLVGIANGQITQTGLVGSGTNGLGSTAGTSGNSVINSKNAWIPGAISIPLIAITFWIGRRFELTALRRQLDRTHK